ncbi:MAG: TraB/GumN family protein, partial [Chitinophagaceae bacterium]
MMIKKHLIKLLSSVLFLLVSFFFLSDTSAQRANTKSLLWRITGNGLLKPSYLYGTMHLYDKKLFQFGDSVYKSLENSEAYAMELDPNSLMDSILLKIGESDTTSLLQKMIDKKQYDTVSKKLEKKLGVSADRITRKMLIAARNKEIYRRRNEDDMSTVVDLYLYDIAHKQGKWVGGIEDVEDQSGISDELGKDFDVNEFVEEDENKMRKYMDRWIDLYVTEDIDKIEQLSNNKQGASAKDLLLNRRNIKMARRMDSLSKLRTTFFAIGAAHLAGDSGVISLMRKNGFKIDPVFSSKKIAPGNYKFVTKEFPWLKIIGPDSLYTASMPGKPTDINKFGNELKMKMYGDIGSNTFFMTGFVEIDSTNNKDKIIENVMANFSSEKIDKKEKKNITSNGIPGVEINALRENVYCRVQIFLTGNKEYMAIVGAMNKENLFTKDANRFLQSFTMNTHVEIKNSGWVTHGDSAKAFSISFPKVPEIYVMPPEKTQKNWNSTLYSVLDIKTNTYYILGINEPVKGHIMLSDSVYFNQRYEAFTSDTSNTGIEKKEFELNGLPAMTIVSKSNKSGLDIVTNVLMINKGNRNYTLVTVTEKNKENNPNIKQFNNSFKILPYKDTDWKKRIISDRMFGTWSPSPIELEAIDSAGLTADELTNTMETNKQRLQYLSYDKYSATSYNILVYPISQYYWTDCDSIFYEDQVARYYTDTSLYHSLNNSNFDSLISKNPVKNGNRNGIEIVVKNAGSYTYKKIRVLRNGDSVYHLISFILKDDLDNVNNKRFFDDFAVNGNILPGHLFENKTSKILTGLESTDSTTFNKAITAMQNAHFTQRDMGLLLPALVKDYALDTAGYTTANEVIASAIKPLINDSAVNIIHDEYLNLAKEKGSIKQILLELLSQYKTGLSYKILGDLIIKSPPQQENNYSLVYFLKDSLQLCATLFPGIEKLYPDSLSAPFVIDLNLTLIDSLLLNKKSALDNSDHIYKTAKGQISGYKKDNNNYYGPFSESVIGMLSLLNTEESEKILNEFLLLSNIDVKQIAAIALLKNNNKVPALEINKISADKYSRVYFYNQLKKIDKPNIFPSKWLSQKSFAEGYLYNYIRDEDEMAEPLS